MEGYKKKRQHSTRVRNKLGLVLVALVCIVGGLIGGQHALWVRGETTGLGSATIPSNANAVDPLDTTAPQGIHNLTADLTFVPPALPVCNLVSLQAMINTIGLTVDAPPATADHATIRYRQAGATDWTNGHDAPLVNTNKIIGSIFWLTSATTYEVEVTIRTHDGTPLAVNQCATKTQPENLVNTVTRLVYVSVAATSGGDGSISRPYKTIQAAVDRSQPGDQILVEPGVYQEAVQFPNSGEPGKYIKVIAQPGAILDASDPAIEGGSLQWVADPNHSGVYTAQLPHDLHYIAGLPKDAIWRDTNLFYEYDDLTGLQDSIGHAGVPMAEGWVVDPVAETITVRTANAPTTYVWHIRLYPYGFTIPTQSYIWLEGFTVRYFYYGVYVQSSSHTVIRDMSIQSNTGIIVNESFGGAANDNRIEGNYLTNPPNKAWGYDAVKGTYMETAAIDVRQGIGTIIRDNRVEDYHDGILGSGTAETDVYRNVVRNVSDDGLEPDGLGQNYRAWGNAIDGIQSGVSLASIDIGPTWIIGNRITQFTGRAFKIGAGISGIGYIYHNTAWSDIPGGFGTQQTPIDADTYTFRNNIFRTKDLAIRWTALMSGVSMDNDNAYSDATYPYMWYSNLYGSHPYQLLSDICHDLLQECHGSQAESKLIDPTHGHFGLQADSPNIDSAVRIPGINDIFTGAGPDRGYLEFGQPEIQW